jgi:hypothetical protein
VGLEASEVYAKAQIIAKFSANSRSFSVILLLQPALDFPFYLRRCEAGTYQIFVFVVVMNKIEFINNGYGVHNFFPYVFSGSTELKSMSISLWGSAKFLLPSRSKGVEPLLLRTDILVQNI